MQSDDQKVWASGVVLKGPYGAIIKEANTHISTETKVVDVLFYTQIIKKVPISKLKVVK